jgi:NADH-quinone oxidoreductase subunit J
MVAELGAVMAANYLGVLETDAPQAVAGASNTKDLGRLIYTDFVYPFELASVILLVAIVAAIAITYRGPKKTKYTDPAEQVRVRAKDRIRVLQMPAEKQD